MYNRYIPEDASYTPVAPVPPSAPPPRPERPPGGPSGAAPLHLPDLLSSGGFSRLFSGGEGLSGLMKTLHLDRLDSGDVLLLLIMLYLLVEGDDMELVIALGLVLLMGLGEEE